MEDFDIRVKTIAGSKYFHVSLKVIGEKTLYEIWEDNHLKFSLESNDDAASTDALKLSDEFSDKEIYPGFVHVLSDVIHSSESDGPRTKRK